MTTFAGSWVNVTAPAGSVRQDWVPAEQPPSPDGSLGQWHVVTDHPGADPRWEWHPAPAAVAPAPAIAPPARVARAAKPRAPQDIPTNIRRGCIAAVAFGVMMPWANVGPFSITGFRINDGKMLMALALAALAWSLAPRLLVVRLVDTVLAVAALFAALIDMGNTSRLGAALGPLVHIQVGAGLMVCVIAAAVWLASLVWEQVRLVRARHRARYVPPAWLQTAH